MSFLLYELSESTAVGTAVGPTLTVDMPAFGLDDSQALFSPGHQCRSTKVRSQDCSIHAPGPSVGAIEAACTLVWPNSHVYMPTKATAAKPPSSPIPDARVIFLSDVL